MTKQMHEGHG